MLLAFTVGCYFAHTIGLLILFRGLQGAAGATWKWAAPSHYLQLLASACNIHASTLAAVMLAS
jgi:hypothetical protein